MTPIINPMYFYLIDLFTNLKSVTDLIMFILALLFLIALLFISFEVIDFDEGDEKEFLKASKKYVLIPLMVLLPLNTLIPSKETMTKMVIAQFITPDNYEFAKGELTDLIDYIFDKIEGDKK